MTNFSDMIIGLHNLARDISIENPAEGFEVRLMADRLAQIGNKLYEKEIANEQ